MKHDGIKRIEIWVVRVREESRLMVWNFKRCPESVMNRNVTYSSSLADMKVRFIIHQPHRPPLNVPHFYIITGFRRDDVANAFQHLIS